MSLTDGISKRAGRPPINDALALVYLVEVGRRLADMSITAFCRDYARRQPRRTQPGLRRLTGESLRRRFTVAQHRLGLLETRNPNAQNPEAGDEAWATINFMVRSELGYE